MSFNISNRVKGGVAAFSLLSVVCVGYKKLVYDQIDNEEFMSKLLAARKEKVKGSIDHHIASNTVMIFSTTTCPACTRAKSALRENNIKFTSFDMDKTEYCNEMNDELFNRTNQRTVPNIFVKGKHIGGCDKTVTLLASGELQRILADESTPYPVPKEAPDRLMK